MNELIIFLMEVALVSMVFFLVYQVIKQWTSPVFKRYYLIGWMCCSSFFPLMSFESRSVPYPSISDKVEDMPLLQEDYSQVLIDSDKDVTDEQVEIKQGSAPELKVQDQGKDSLSLSRAEILILLYLLGVTFLGCRLITGVFQIWRMKVNAKKLLIDDTRVFVDQNNKVRGASFFNWIFIGEHFLPEKEAILKHEKMHARLGHSMDVFLSHLYGVIFWINPLSWILKRYVSVNTELEVDQKLSDELGFSSYSNVLLRLSNRVVGFKMMNHFSAKHLKFRIMELKNPKRLQKWVWIIVPFLLVFSFVLVSCETLELTSEEALKDVKTITTRFHSHQSDTQQKTDKIVAIANFLPDGTLDEFVEQTTYPYDHEYEKKKEFWEQSDKVGIPYIMDGLSLGTAQKSILYGSDWPSSYAKRLIEREKNESDNTFLFSKEIEIDNVLKPTEIKHKKIYDEKVFYDFISPDVTEFFTYDGDKVIETAYARTYRELVHTNESHKRLQEVVERNRDEDQKKFLESLKANSGVKQVSSIYTYDGDLLTSIVFGKMENPSEYKLYYDGNVLSKIEYYIRGELVNTRNHYYKNGLKDRMEIFNRYNEPEYTISYSYEYW
ncbi:MAG: hypothetical protein AAF789_14070 [Bacteroidota bacterium]